MPRFRTSLPLEDELEKIRRLAAAAPAAGSASANENNTETRWVSDPKRSTWSLARDDVKPSTESKTTTENKPVEIPVEPYTAPTNEELGIHTLGQGQPGAYNQNQIDKSLSAQLKAYDQRTTDMGIGPLPPQETAWSRLGSAMSPIGDTLTDFVQMPIDLGLNVADRLGAAWEGFTQGGGNKIEAVVPKVEDTKPTAAAAQGIDLAAAGKLLQKIGEKQTTELPSPPTQEGGSNTSQQTIALVNPGKELEKFINLWGS